MEYKNKKRLLKDLPFGDLKIGKVLDRVNGSYQITRFPTYYKEGGSSDNATSILDETEKNIIDLVWDNEDWFEPAIVDHIDFIPVDSGILLKFDSIDAIDKEDLIKGLIHILEHLKDGSYTWNKFDDITTRITTHLATLLIK